jgi:hypothetical protein
MCSGALSKFCLQIIQKRGSYILQIMDLCGIKILRYLHISCNILKIFIKLMTHIIIKKRQYQICWLCDSYAIRATFNDRLPQHIDISYLGFPKISHTFSRLIRQTWEKQRHNSVWRHAWVIIITWSQLSKFSPRVWCA